MSALISDPQTQVLSSQSGLWRAEVNPRGATLISLWRGDDEIVTSPNHEPFFAFAGALMAPWPNRLEDGEWQFSGRRLRAPINDPSGNNANHGLAFGSLFDVTSSSSDSVTFATSIRHDAGYPFDVRLQVSYQLTEEGLAIDIAAKNLEDFAVPFAVGVHPYFVCDEDSILNLHARKLMHKDSRGLPTTEIAINDSNIVRRGQNRTNALQIDDCVFDFDQISESRICTELIRRSKNLIVKLRQSQNLHYLMIFKYEDQFKRTLLALEPQSAKANALRLEPARHLLPGGESQHYQINITAEGPA